MVVAACRLHSLQRCNTIEDEVAKSKTVTSKGGETTMKKMTALLVGIAFSLSMAGLSVAQKPAAPATEQKKEMMDKKDETKAEKGEKKAKRTPSRKDDAAAIDKEEYQKKEGPKKDEPRK
jgi:preprotein translocase subunit SecG